MLDLYYKMQMRENFYGFMMNNPCFFTNFAVSFHEIITL